MIKKTLIKIVVFPLFFLMGFFLIFEILNWVESSPTYTLVEVIKKDIQWLKNLKIW